MALPYIIGFWIGSLLFKGKIEIPVTATIVLVTLALSGDIPWY